MICFIQSINQYLFYVYVPAEKHKQNPLGLPLASVFTSFTFARTIEPHQHDSFLKTSKIKIELYF